MNTEVIRKTENDYTVRSLPQSIDTEKRQGASVVLQDRIVRPSEASAITGRSLASIWRDEKAGTFPRRLRIGANAVGYRLSSVQEWLDSRETVTIENVKPVAPGCKTRGRKPHAVEV